MVDGSTRHLLISWWHKSDLNPSLRLGSPYPRAPIQIRAGYNHHSKTASSQSGLPHRHRLLQRCRSFYVYEVGD